MEKIILMLLYNALIFTNIILCPSFVSKLCDCFNIFDFILLLLNVSILLFNLINLFILMDD